MSLRLVNLRDLCSPSACILDHEADLKYGEALEQGSPYLMSRNCILCHLFIQWQQVRSQGGGGGGRFKVR